MRHDIISNKERETIMRIAVVTGASSGIGREFARELDKKGLDEIWLIARREERLMALKDELCTSGRVMRLDLTDDADIDAFERTLEREKPDVMYMVNAAGFGKIGRYDEISREDNAGMMALNVSALVRLSYAVIPYTKKGSRIIEMGSASSFLPLPNFNIYASTKAFVVHFSNALNEELKERGVSVTVVCPGFVKTEFLKVADNSEQRHGPHKYWPMYDAGDIVRRAVRNADRGRAFSVYGAFTKLHRIMARILPHPLLYRIWALMQKK